MNQTSAYCGLFCEACPDYIKTMNGEATDRKCHGCKSNTVNKWCEICHFKVCAREKGHEFCSECDVYPCKDLIKFKEDTEYPYHIDVFEHFTIIQSSGESKWRDEMDKKYRGNDGNRIDWYKELNTRKPNTQ